MILLEAFISLYNISCISLIIIHVCDIGIYYHLKRKSTNESGRSFCKKGIIPSSRTVLVLSLLLLIGILCKLELSFIT